MVKEVEGLKGELTKEKDNLSKGWNKLKVDREGLKKQWEDVGAQVANLIKSLPDKFITGDIVQSKLTTMRKDLDKAFIPIQRDEDLKRIEGDIVLYNKNYPKDQSLQLELSKYIPIQFNQGKSTINRSTQIQDLVNYIDDLKIRLPKEGLLVSEDGLTAKAAEILSTVASKYMTIPKTRFATLSYVDGKAKGLDKEVKKLNTTLSDLKAAAFTLANIGILEGVLDQRYLLQISNDEHGNPHDVLKLLFTSSDESHSLSLRTEDRDGDIVTDDMLDAKLESLQTELSNLYHKIDSSDPTCLTSTLNQAITNVETKINTVACNLASSINHLSGSVREDFIIQSRRRINSQIGINNLSNQVQAISNNVDNIELVVLAQAIAFEDVLDDLNELQETIGMVVDNGIDTFSDIREDIQALQRSSNNHSSSIDRLSLESVLFRIWSIAQVSQASSWFITLANRISYNHNLISTNHTSINNTFSNLVHTVTSDLTSLRGRLDNSITNLDQTFTGRIQTLTNQFVHDLAANTGRHNQLVSTVNGLDVTLNNRLSSLTSGTLVGLAILFSKSTRLTTRLNGLDVSLSNRLSSLSSGTLVGLAMLFNKNARLTTRLNSLDAHTSGRFRNVIYGQALAFSLLANRNNTLNRRITTLDQQTSSQIRTLTTGVAVSTAILSTRNNKLNFKIAQLSSPNGEITRISREIGEEVKTWARQFLVSRYEGEATSSRITALEDGEDKEVEEDEFNGFLVDSAYAEDGMELDDQYNYTANDDQPFQPLMDHYFDQDQQYHDQTIQQDDNIPQIEEIQPNEDLPHGDIPQDESENDIEDENNNALDENIINEDENGDGEDSSENDEDENDGQYPNEDFLNLYKEIMGKSWNRNIYQRNPLNIMRSHPTGKHLLKIFQEYVKVDGNTMRCYNKLFAYSYLTDPDIQQNEHTTFAGQTCRLLFGLSMLISLAEDDPVDVKKFKKLAEVIETKWKHYKGNKEAYMGKMKGREGEAILWDS